LTKVAADAKRVITMERISMAIYLWNSGVKVRCGREVGKT